MNLLTTLYAWACERLYAELAGGYDWVSWLVSLGHWATWRCVALNNLLRTAPAKAEPAASSPRVLEIGFGTGELLLEMARRRFTVHGLELSQPMHEITAAKLQRRDLVVPRMRALAQAMPLADDSYAAMISTFPAPYILDPATLRECARVLRKPQPELNLPGGQLVIVGLWVGWNNPLLRKLVPLFYSTPDQDFKNQIRQRLAQAGFSSTLIDHPIGRVSVGVIVGERVEG